MKMERFGIFPIRLRSSLARKSFSSSVFSINSCWALRSILLRMTFSALTTKIWPKGLDKIWLTFWALGLRALLLFWAVFCSSRISKRMSRLISPAAGCGNIHDGSKCSMVFRLGMMEDFKPEGIITKKLWAKFLFSGSFSAKYKSR